MPLLLPWAGLLLLLLLRANRVGQAWLVGLPLATFFAIQSALAPALDFIPSQGLGMLFDVAGALAIGIAAVWLTAPYLAGRVRFLTFLKVLLALLVASGLAYASRQDWAEAEGELFAAAIFLAFVVLVLAAALSLTGLICRHDLRPVRVLVWLPLWLAGGFAVLAFPFALVALLSGGGEAVAVFGAGIALGTAVTFAVILPFLVLSFVNRLYRERLGQLLRVGTDGVPPLAMPVPASSQAT